MSTNSKHFINHNTERFEAYLDSVTDGKIKISSSRTNSLPMASRWSAQITGEVAYPDPPWQLPFTYIAKREVQVNDTQ